MKNCKSNQNWSRSVICIAILIICLFSVAITAYAATLTVDASNFSFSNYLTITANNEEGTSYGSVTISGGTVTIKASNRNSVYQSTTTVTVTNSSTVKVTVNYTDTSGTATTIDLAAGDCFTQTCESVRFKGEKTATFTITAVTPDETKYTPTFLAPIKGSYTVDGINISDTTCPSTIKNTTTAYVLSASPSANYSFYGWLSSTKGLISTSASYNYYCGANETIYPLFIPSNGAVYYVPGDTSGFCYYAYLDTACTAAKSASAKQVIPVKSGTVYASSSTTIEIPSGVTLLLPYASGQTTVQGSSADLPYANYTTSQTNTNHSTSSGVYLELTVPSGTTITNNGTIVVGGVVAAVASNDCGGCGGSHSNIVLNGTLNLGSNSILSTIGYIYGTGSIVTTGSGAKIYQPFVVGDFLNGSFTVGTVLSDYFSKAVDPFRQWSVDNIRTNITVTSGNYICCYATLFASGSFYSSNSVLVGDSSVDGLIRLSDGATFTSYYDTSRALTDYTYQIYSGADVWTEYYGIGRNMITLSGGATYGNLSLTVLGKTTNMSELTFWVPYNIDLTMTKGSYYIPYSMGLLPGASIMVDSSAHLYLGDSSKARNFIVFDGLTDYSSVVSQNILKGKPNSITTAYGRLGDDHYPTTAALQKAGFNGTANLIVDGTLHIQNKVSFGGYVQTNGTGTVEVNSGAITSCTEQIGVVGEDTILYTSYANFVGMTVRTLNAMLYTANGVIVMEAGKSYAGVSDSEHTIDSYTYTVYTSSADKSACSQITEDDGFDAVIVGTWKCADGEHSYTSEVTTAATCTATGVKTYTCSICGHSYTEEIAAMGHSFTKYVPNNDTDGTSTAYCDNCCVETHTMQLFTIDAANVVLGNNLDMLFHIVYNGSVDPSGAGYYVQLERTKYTTDGTETVTVQYFYDDSTNSWATNSYITYGDLAAKEMCDAITLAVYDADNNRVSNIWTDSMRDYAMRQIEKFEQIKDSDKILTLLVDMLNYGAEAQKRFTYNTDDLANSLLTDEQQEAYATTTVTKGLAEGAESDVQSPWVASNLVTTSNIQFLLAFDGITDGMTATVTFTNHYGGDPTSIDITEFGTAGNYRYVAIEELVVADAWQPVTVTIYNSDGSTYATCVDSIAGYLARYTAYSKINAAYLKFAQAAYAYFH